MAKPLLLFMGFFLMGIHSSVYAGYDYQFEARPYEMGQMESEMTAKLTRGLTNVMFGWTELGRTPVTLSRRPEGNVLKGIFLGIPYGIFRTVGRTIVGVYEVVTCFAPQKPIFQDLEGDIF